VESPLPDSLSVTPDDGHSLFNDNIDLAHQHIEMVMFHLSDPETVAHLIQAHQRGVSIRLILDGKMLSSNSSQAIRDSLLQNGIEVRSSSTAFSITHEKAAVFDGHEAIVSSINLTKNVGFTRDFGILTEDADVVAEMESVFEADWKNAEGNGSVTPELSNGKLIWSPVNSKEKIISLIQKAQQSLFVETENLGDSDVLAALEAKAKEGVKVTVVVPACVEGMTPTRNLPYLQSLADSQVNALASVPPYSSAHPYIHAKAIVVDGETFYVGSENLSHNSLQNAREVGLIEQNPSIAKSIATILENDATEAKAVGELQNFSCKTKGSLTDE
jgi:phosphatidylserine/phosphatidylglycerophosphate/cardiolipin synthase-like enzyme